ncbi:hypothetical protein RRG08_031382 [Elysia crispata]|uniref:Methyltransferase type 11 domain-containing protein n=1 Tax=Elysia crispata TaxID=231223 RepID=A0AAE0ZMU5_9GAST|nr:hypothetical protein RRG08_031382 [Elysia crispata]
MSGKKTTEFLYQTFLDPSTGTENTSKIYGKFSTQYDQIMSGFQYKAPHYMVESLTRVMGDRNRAGMKIMDLACGSGISGQALHEAGFTQVDGLDGSGEMLAVSRAKGVYKDLFQAFVAIGKGELNIPDNTYDALTICASMGVNMVPPEGIYEMHRLVKPGGYIVNVLRQETVEEIEGFKDKLEPMMHQMEADGKWKLLSRVVFPDYLVDQGGVVFTHQVC